ncbi:MAG TPA: SDR family NAD(P)-dependent oxidoreductase, partial [Pirellulales bacterium]|nr:SDR family NAD(P)-dependent oxidoreductase [Pirellulales bacterium]
MKPHVRDTNPWLAVGMGAGFALLVAGAVRRRFAYSFRNKVVVITGGSRGLGLCLARQFGAEGARLALCARDEDELRRARDDLHSRGIDPLTVECDVTNRQQVNAFVREVVGRYGGIDVLVNNAGVIQSGPMETMTIEDYERAMDVHYWGP